MFHIVEDMSISKTCHNGTKTRFLGEPFSYGIRHISCDSVNYDLMSIESQWNMAYPALKCLTYRTAQSLHYPLRRMCDVIKQNESELANTVFFFFFFFFLKIQPNKAHSSFCFLLFVQSFNCLYLWNQLPNLCGFFTKLKPILKHYPGIKCLKKKSNISTSGFHAYHTFWDGELLKRKLFISFSDHTTDVVDKKYKEGTKGWLVHLRSWWRDGKE